LLVATCSTVFELHNFEIEVASVADGRKTFYLAVSIVVADAKGEEVVDIESRSHVAIIRACAAPRRRG
jgi:hypothetical protein